MNTTEPAAATLAAGAVAQKDAAALPVDIGILRFGPIFAMVFTAVYFFGVYTNYGPIRYYPEVMEIHLYDQPASKGPAMYWYGWIINGLLGGIIASIASSFLPRDWLDRVWMRWAWASVAVAIGSIVVLSYLLREFFLR
jgi:hypothetical protein